MHGSVDICVSLCACARQYIGKCVRGHTHTQARVCFFAF